MKKYLVLLLSLVLAMTTLASCGSKDVNQDALGSLIGEYQAVEFDNGNDNDYVGGWWHLSIRDELSDEGSDFSIYDNEAGNPGVEGKMLLVDDANIKIEINPDYYDELPTSSWQDSGDFLEMTYAVTDDGIELTNNGKTIHFVKESVDEE